jgi:hypothetical protein
MYSSAMQLTGVGAGVGTRVGAGVGAAVGAFHKDNGSVSIKSPAASNETGAAMWVCVHTLQVITSHQRWHTLFLSVIKKIISLQVINC